LSKTAVQTFYGASLLVEIEKNVFSFAVWWHLWGTSQVGVFVFLANFIWPWAPIQWVNFWDQNVLESRLSSESLEPWLAFYHICSKNFG